MKGIGYCRVSTDEQVIDGFSLETQEQEIKKYCHDNNIDLLNVYVDGGSSAFKNSLKDRPQGKFVVEHIFDKNIDCIVSISDDRMFRQLEDSIVINNICDKNNIQLLYTRQQQFNTMDSTTSFLIKNVNAMINEYYSRIYSVKVKKGIENKMNKDQRSIF